jgi:hypothetical protein
MRAGPTLAAGVNLAVLGHNLEGLRRQVLRLGRQTVDCDGIARIDLQDGAPRCFEIAPMNRFRCRGQIMMRHE